MGGTDIDFSRYPVLAVDDEPDNLDVIRYSFKRSHPLLFARSGAEALKLLEEHQIAVIVSDQRMPAMSGLELLGRAGKARPDAVGVLLTAYGDVPMLSQAINSIAGLSVRAEALRSGRPGGCDQAGGGATPPGGGEPAAGRKARAAQRVPQA